MPWGLKRFQEARCLHSLTFSCYRRAPRLEAPRSRDIFEQTLERARKWYGFYIAGYVVMPEPVHLLVTEPERAKLSLALQMLKQNVARELREVEGGSFWQARYYDFNVWTEAKRIEKLRYIHRNPVSRGLVSSPELWAWSSFRRSSAAEAGLISLGALRRGLKPAPFQHSFSARTRAIPGLARALVDEDRYWRVGAGVRHMLNHRAHGDRIAYDEAHTLRGSGAVSLAQDCAEVEAHELYQFGGTSRFADDLFDIRKCFCGGDILSKRTHLRMADRRLERGDDIMELFGRS
jgi:putative transposase